MSTVFAHIALVINAALFASVWQGALIVGSVWLGLRCLPRLGSASRYAIWLTTLTALVVIPVYSALKSAQFEEPEAVSIPMEVRQAISSVSLPQAGPAPRSQSRVIVKTFARPGRQVLLPQAFVFMIALVWASVALGQMLRLAMNFWEIAAIRRESYVWSKAYEFPILLSDRVHVPIAIGFLRPAVVLPESILENLDEQALKAILIHEIAHLRRYDVWTNALVRGIETLICLNPISWFVSGQISTEREIACDDWIVARSDSREEFARALTLMASATRSRPPLAAPNALGSRHTIVRRVENLMDDERPRNLRFSTAALGGVLMWLALIAFTVQSVSPALAFAALPAHNSPTILALGCTQRDQGPLYHHQLGPGGPRMNSPSLSKATLQEIVIRYPSTTTYEVQVDASGHPHDVIILHSSKVRALDRRVAQSILDSKFDPAVHNCAKMPSVFASAASRLPTPTVFLYTRPATPVVYGRPTKPIKGACGVPHRNPAIVHLVRPTLDDSMKKLILATQRTFINTVNVRLNASGAVISAVVSRSSGQRIFDEATLMAAKQTRYTPRVANCTSAPGDYFIMAAFSQRLVL